MTDTVIPRIPYYGYKSDDSLLNILISCPKSIGVALTASNMSDLPDGGAGGEYNVFFFGSANRKTVFAIGFNGSPTINIRQYFNQGWLTNWQKLNITYS